METSISNEIIKVLDALCDKFGIAVDWSSNNILPYIETLMDKCVTYEVSTSLFWMLLAFIGLCVGAYLCIHGNTVYKESEYLDGEGSIIIGAGLLIIAIVIIVVQSLDLIQCSTFPESIIIDKMMHYSNLIS